MIFLNIYFYLSFHAGRLCYGGQLVRVGPRATGGREGLGSQQQLLVLLHLHLEIAEILVRWFELVLIEGSFVIKFPLKEKWSKELANKEKMQHIL